jgi:glycosyltransferase involved in cell wall biosynthesis
MKAFNLLGLRCQIFLKRSNGEMIREVVLVFRKPYPSAFSIEFLFNTIFWEFKRQKGFRKHILPYYTSGIKSVVFNVSSLTLFRNKIIHVTGDTYYAILGAVFCKRIITIHDLSFLTRTTGTRKKILKLFWITLPVKFSHKITVVSETTKGELMKEVSVRADKIRVIYNFIDPIYQPYDRFFNSLSPRILQVGTDFNKNIKNLVEALSGLVCTLVIVGKLSQEQKQLLDTSGIEYINRHSLTREELYQEYTLADLMTFVSTIEGFGMPILEAQATGLPVVTSNCSSMPEVAGKGALLVDPFKPESIRRGILEIITSAATRERFVKAGYANTRRFSKEKIAADYLKLYQEL